MKLIYVNNNERVMYGIADGRCRKHIRTTTNYDDWTSKQGITGHTWKGKFW